jgi:hypothetical protein
MEHVAEIYSKTAKRLWNNFETHFISSSMIIFISARVFGLFLFALVMRS